jgi:hypothetical protein
MVKRIKVGNYTYFPNSKTPDYVIKNLVDFLITHPNTKIPNFPNMFVEKNGKKYFNPFDIKKFAIKEGDEYYNYNVIYDYDKNKREQYPVKIVSDNKNLKFKVTEQGWVPVLTDENGNVVKEFPDKIVRAKTFQKSVGKLVREATADTGLPLRAVPKITEVVMENPENGEKNIYKFSWKKLNNVYIISNEGQFELKNVETKKGEPLGNNIAMEKAQKVEKNYKPINEEKVLPGFVKNHGKVINEIPLPNGQTIYKFSDRQMFITTENGGLQKIAKFEKVQLPTQNGIVEGYIVAIPNGNYTLKATNGLTGEAQKVINSKFFKDLNASVAKKEQTSVKKEQTYEDDYTPF